MADIRIPGDELEQVSQALGFVLDHIDTGNSGVDLDRALGYPLIHQGNHFESRWSDGRFQLNKQCTTIKKAVDDILTQFKDTDDQAAAHLDGA
ncbi:hypothetical protein [Peterkaempfera bronchialis]|uniref:Uncharacterized protein n=1 Tax=Peterkaempfera bronchialis TaxID=2126346 RepID=A0A345SUJ9_9ACTN|nr:hypothetical protein [Peterkaempfera bronchialis]AXI77404.1 hypothetical protein C7M71_008075 [Peterkaempfera bronchialis]